MGDAYDRQDSGDHERDEVNSERTKEVLLRFQGQVIGQAKRVGSRLKNAFPRELVRDGKLFSAEM